MMSDVSYYVRRYWRQAALLSACTLAIYLLFFFRLQTLLPGYNSAEVITQQTTQHLHVIWNNPDYAPYKLILWALHKLGLHAVLNARVLSALFGLVAVGLFFYVVKAWFSTRITIVSTILFASSSSFLHAARFGSPLILQMSVLVIFAIILFYQTDREALNPWLRNASKYGLALLLLISLYVPGTVWLLLLGAVLLRKQIWLVIRRQSRLHLGLLGLLSVTSLAPLIWISLHNSSFALLMLGLPQSLPGVSDIWHNFVTLILQLAWKSHGQAAISLIGAPLLGTISLALVFLGLAAQLQKPRLHTNYYLVLAVPLTLLLASLGGPVTYIMLVPLLYLLAAGGLFYLLDQWFRVFPKNPVARVLGVSLVSVLVLFSITYQLRSYYIAWPHAETTRKAYTLPQPR